jgi:alpha-glucosidase
MRLPKSWRRAIGLLLAPFILLSVAHADPIAERIGDGIVRFWPDAVSRDAALPSLALAEPRPALGEMPAGFAVRPEFRMVQGARTVHVEVPRGTTFYGTGEVAGTLARGGRTTMCWNFDAYGYGLGTPSLYQSHPWVLGVRADGSSFGVLADTPGRVTIDLTHGIEFRMQGPVFPLIVIERHTPQEVVSALSGLVGRSPLPPRWALGFQQCRYSYAPDTEVVRVAREFRARGLPCDVLWMDIDYMDQHKPFTFDPVGFANPHALSDTLHARGFKGVWILDPGIKQQPGDAVYEDGTAGDHWVKMPDGTPVWGKVWPGGCVFPDFTRRDTRTWYSRLVGQFVARSGADGIWNDMNEPAVFDVDGKTLPETARHEADAELGGPAYHTRYHNVYGMLMARSSWEGMRAEHPDRRPFVLSRANYIGGNRWAAAWTGDNKATAEHLGWALPMALNLGLSGQPFAGPDIGGYAGALNGDEFATWMGLGSLLPFSRAHTEKGGMRKEPWSFGPRIEALCRRALETRYRLLPYLYSTFEEASRTGLPVARPAFFADPAADWLRTVEHEFLLGGDVLVDLKFKPEWKDMKRLSDDRTAWRAATVVPGEPSEALPGLSVRAGAIVPLGPVVAYSDERPLDVVELLVAPNAAGHAEGWLYEDAGDGYGYQHGQFRRAHFVAETQGRTLRVRLAGAEGTWQPPPGRHYQVTVLGGVKGQKVEGP